MRFIVISVTDGSFLIRSEHDTKEKAFTAFHNLCGLLFADSSMAGKKGMVRVLDENLDTVEGKMEFIDRTGESVPTVEETTEE